MVKNSIEKIEEIEEKIVDGIVHPQLTLSRDAAGDGGRGHLLRPYGNAMGGAIRHLLVLD